MEPFFVFLQSYWWLAFPAFGLLAAAGNGWERAARRRHRRRIEVMHAKAEIKAAQSSGRAKGVPAASLPPMVGATAAEATEAPATGTLEGIMATHDDIIARWLEYELDVSKVIAFPAMSDGRQPLTAAFLRAKRVADGLRPASNKAKVSKDQLAEYRAAVTDFDVAFDLAERDARRIRDSEFSDAERKRLDTAKQLLSVAIDQAATPAERQLAYRRVREELNGLISLSDEAIVVLENKVMLELAPVNSDEAADATSQHPSTTSPVQKPTPPVADATPPSAMPPAGPWPVPARTNTDTPGRVVHPKPQH